METVMIGAGLWQVAILVGIVNLYLSIVNFAIIRLDRTNYFEMICGDHSLLHYYCATTIVIEINLIGHFFKNRVFLLPQDTLK